MGTPVPRLVKIVFAVLLAAAAGLFALSGSGGPSAAQAVEVPSADSKLVQLLDTTVSSDGASMASCLSRRAGERGVATRQVTLERAGYLYTSLTAASGDWDLAVFNEAGRRTSGGATTSASEVASGYVGSGTFTVQACRRSGDASDARLMADFTPFPTNVTPEKVQLVDVKTPTRAAKDRLVALDVDLTEHGHEGSLGVVLHGKADADKLRRAGFEWEVEVDDVTARNRNDRVADRRFASRVAASDLPSGRDGYRTLEDYNNEMKTLADQNPGLVKLVSLPNKTYEGRTVMALEITTNVNQANGKPVFLNMGVHHAREWPSGEHAMEWAYQLIKGFKAGDERTVKIVQGTRNIVLPLVNPDGFNASRTAGALGQPNDPDGGRNEDMPGGDTAFLVAGGGTGGEYRRKNCRLPDNSERGNCATSLGLAERGVDPNRNYGGFWGGPGADPSNQLTQTYRGPAPFSEPETKNVKALVGSNQVTTLITNHTTAGLVLRAPGLASLGDPVDEQRGYKALGDELSLHNGYFSQKSFELYDTTGTTEDWSYNATGGFGFTFEIYCGAPNYKTGDCNDPAFHPRFETMVKEWTGDSDQANHVKDPGRNEENPFGNVAKFDGKGNREAYFVAAESTLNEARHSVIEGEAPAGATLRIKKTFKTETFPQPQPDGTKKPIFFDDSLESVYEVGSTGAFRWHTNPSTRPIVAKERGERDGGEPAPPEMQSGAPAGGSGTDPAGEDEVAGPCADANAPNSACWNEHSIVVPATGDNRSANIRVVWSTPASDYDIKLFEDTNNDGNTGEGDKEVAVSENGATNEEEVGLTGSPRLTPGVKYLLRVTNFAAGEPYDVEIRWNGPEPFKPAQVESFTMTCEVGGKVLQTTQVQVDRGQTTRPDLGECRRLAAPAPQPQPQPVPLQKPSTCFAGSGFRSVGVTPRGRGVQFRFSRRLNNPVTVSVFQQSIGRRVTGERLITRFSRRTKSFTWSGRSSSKSKRVRDGYLFARFSMQTPNGTDTRRITLRRSKGRFVKRPDFYRRATCDALPSFKIERPVFGGASNRPLNISFRIAKPGRVQVDVVRGAKRVKRFGPTNRRAGVTHRLRLDPKALAKGEYRVRITVLVPGGRPLTATLVARRL